MLTPQGQGEPRSKFRLAGGREIVHNPHGILWDVCPSFFHVSSCLPCPHGAPVSLSFPVSPSSLSALLPLHLCYGWPWDVLPSAWQGWLRWERDLVAWLTNKCTLCLSVTCVCSGVLSPGTAALRKAAPLAAWRAWSNQAKLPTRAISCPLTRTCTPTSVTQPIAPSQPAQMPLTVPFPSGQKSQPLQTASRKAQSQLRPPVVGLMYLRPQEAANAPMEAT